MLQSGGITLPQKEVFHVEHDRFASFLNRPDETSLFLFGMARQYFGTDGIRGRANTSPLTPEFMIPLARAVRSVLEIPAGEVVLIGLDTRVSGVMLEAALTSAFLSEGLNVGHLGVVSTPLTACLTRQSNAAAGVMITASHNPYEDNGVKFFTREGEKLSDQQEEAIEKIITLKTGYSPSSSSLGISLSPEQPEEVYFNQLQQIVGERRFEHIKAVVDCANGSNSFHAISFLESLGLEVIAFASEPDGQNINQQCGAVHPESAAQLVIEHQAQLGICFDGDGDRLIMIDEKGQLVSGDRLLYSAAVAMQARGELQQNTLVATIMSNLGLRDALARKGLSLVTTPVGDRAVYEAMQKGSFNLGGENSGHLIFGDYSTTGDGLLSAILILIEMQRAEKSLSALSEEMREYPSLLINVPVQSKPLLDSVEGLSEAVAIIERDFGEKGRVLLRYSGTEKKLRILVEATDPQQVEQAGATLRSFVEQSSSFKAK